jgi:hypothetical protein
MVVGAGIAAYGKPFLRVLPLVPRGVGGASVKKKDFCKIIVATVFSFGCRFAPVRRALKGVRLSALLLLHSHLRLMFSESRALSC